MRYVVLQSLHLVCVCVSRADAFSPSNFAVSPVALRDCLTAEAGVSSSSLSAARYGGARTSTTASKYRSHVTTLLRAADTTAHGDIITHDSDCSRAVGA